MSKLPHFAFQIAACALALATIARAADGAGVNLSWSDCYPDGAIRDLAFACDTNSGASVLVASYVTPGAGIQQVTGNEIYVELVFAGDTVPSWWQMFNAGSCRAPALSIHLDLPAGSACADFWAGQALAGIALYDVDPYLGPNSCRLRAAAAVPQPADEAGGTEYFSCRFAVDHTATVGTGACGGCTTPACIALTAIRVTTSTSANDVYLNASTTGSGSNWITWQGGAGATTQTGTGCPALVPAQRRTWGAIKALYR